MSWRHLTLAAVVVTAAAGCGDDDSATPATTGAASSAPSATEVPPATDAAGPTFEWSAAPSLLAPRSAHGVVVVEDAIYVVGGTGEDGTAIAAVERFDGTAWTEISELPGDGVNAPSVAAMDGRIYVIGGFTGRSARPTAEVHVHDVAAGTWGTAAPLPVASGGHAAAVLDGRIHVIGGGTARSTIADHVVYDPATDSWTAAAPLPNAEGSPAVVVLDGTLWAIGGRSGRDDFGEVYVYDPASDSWSTGPAIEPHGTAGAAVVCDTIVVVGGEAQADDEVLADVYVLVDGAWEAGAPLPTARSFARAVVFGEELYVVGGSTVYGRSHGSPGSETVERATIAC